MCLSSLLWIAVCGAVGKCDVVMSERERSVGSRGGHQIVSVIAASLLWIAVSGSVGKSDIVMSEREICRQPGRASNCRHCAAGERGDSEPLLQNFGFTTKLQPIFFLHTKSNYSFLLFFCARRKENVSRLME